MFLQGAARVRQQGKDDRINRSKQVHQRGLWVVGQKGGWGVINGMVVTIHILSLTLSRKSNNDVELRNF
jgi:hypothetical protein